MILQHICITGLKIEKKVLKNQLHVNFFHAFFCNLDIFTFIFYNLYLYCTFCSILFSVILSSLSRIAILVRTTQ